MTDPSRTQAGTVGPRRQCGTMAVYHRLCEMDPTFRESLASIERRTQEVVNSDCMKRERRLLFRIQVVVHVIYHAPDERLSRRQIQSQIRILNQDFRMRNPSRRSVPRPWRSLAADAGIEFSLAKQDPEGKPSSGVTYTQTDRESFGTGDSLKRTGSGGIDSWDPSKYLNLWVAPLAGGLLGYAQFPGGPEDTDGVVISYKAFGTQGVSVPPFDQGRTATHEIGHYLNLYHLWGDTMDCRGTDHCCDTPPQRSPNYGKPTFPKISCDNGPHGDMFMNFMDYTDDAAMCLFTESQVARMVATLTGPRKSLDPNPLPLTQRRGSS
jgi:hypothetical protein